MSKRQLLCVLGVWVMVFLFLGLPAMFDKVVALVTGFIILITSYTLPAPKKNESELKETFIETKNE